MDQERLRSSWQAPPPSQQDEILETGAEAAAAAASQDYADREVFYGSASMTIKGCQYYRGQAHAGEYVNLVREPQNPYDRNAVRVDNMGGVQVGHVARQQAAALQPLLDDRKATAPRVEATIPYEQVNKYEQPMNVNIYGLPEHTQWILAQLRKDGVRLDASSVGGAGGGSARYGGGYAGGAGGGPAAVVSMRIMSPAQSQKELDEIFDKLEVDLSHLPQGPTMPRILAVIKTPLFEHQTQGVVWMVQRETTPVSASVNDGLPPFWQKVKEMGRVVYFNGITKSSSLNPPAPVRGGILADDMGLGKTLQVLSLVVGNPPPGVDYVAQAQAAAQEVSPELSLIQENAQAPGPEVMPEQAGEDPSQSLNAATPPPGPSAPPVGAAPQALTPSTAAPASPPALVHAPASVPDLALEMPSVDKFKGRKIPELKQELRARGLPVSGNKDALISRLRQAETAMSHAHAQAVTGAGDTPARPPQTRTAPPAPPVSTAPANGPRGTLIVCPMSVLSNWEDQINTHVRGGALKVYAYHGSGRQTEGSALAEYDVVITTYGTLASEYVPGLPAAAVPVAGVKRKIAHGLYAVGWHRVVLDEAHTIRNSKTKVYQACTGLDTERRWALTGTPLQNKSEDVQALFGFLRMAPVDDISVFRRAIARPIRQGEEAGLALLRVLLKSVALRRTKAAILTSLPSKTVEVHSVELDGYHREVYDTLYQSARGAFKAALDVGDKEVLTMYSSVLECLMRLRQACCSTTLIPPDRLKAAQDVLEQLGHKGGAKLSQEEAKRLFDKLKGLLADEEDMECSICLETMTAEVAQLLRGCQHVFCGACMDRLVETGVCALCRAPFKRNQIVSGQELASTHATETPPPVAAFTSTDPPPKVKALLQRLHAIAQTDPTDKSVVFSQFTSFLNIIGTHLEAAGVPYTRLDGSMTARKRLAALHSFADLSAGSPRVFLVSLKAGGTGLNLTSANHCFICDPWWNASTEEQAMDRVHRIGQTKPVTVVRYVGQNTCEETILEIQEAKKALGAGALKKLSPEEMRKVRLADLRHIFKC